VASGLHRKLDEICALLGYCAAYFKNSLLTCQENIFVQSSRVKKCKKSLSFFVRRIKTFLLDLYFDVSKIRNL
jgi:hypothetical protein